MNERLRGRLLVFAAAFFWGTSATLARHVFRDLHVPALTVVELRLAFALLMLVPWLMARRPQALRIERRDVPYFLVLGTAGVAIMQGGYYYSISVFGVGLAILLQYLAPSLVMAWDWLRGGRVSATTLWAVGCAVAGTALLVGGIDAAAIHATWWQWAIGFSTSFVFAFYIVFSKRGLRTYAPETLLVWSFAIALVVWAVVTPPWRIAAAHYSATAWTMFAGLGLFSTLAPFVCFYAGLRRLPATEAGVIATLEPVVAVITAWLVLGEGLRPMQWGGAGLVLAAAVLAALSPDEKVGRGTTPVAPLEH